MDAFEHFWAQEDIFSIKKIIQAYIFHDSKLCVHIQKAYVKFITST